MSKERELGINQQYGDFRPCHSREGGRHHEVGSALGANPAPSRHKSESPEYKELVNEYKPLIFDKKAETWGKIKSDILQLAKENFRMKDEREPVLGAIIPEDEIENFANITTEGDIISYNSLEEAFLDPETVVTLLEDPETDKIIGYSWAMPMKKMDPRPDKPETAYVYQCVIEKDYRGNKLIEKIITPLLQELYQQGYKYAEADARNYLPEGETRKKTYAKSAINEFEGTFRGKPYNHNQFSIGEQIHGIINIEAYLKKK